MPIGGAAGARRISAAVAGSTVTGFREVTCRNIGWYAAGRNVGDESSLGSSPLDGPITRRRIGPDPLGPVPLGPVPLGSVPLGPVPLGPVPLGPVRADPVEIDPAVVGPDVLGHARVRLLPAAVGRVVIVSVGASIERIGWG
jgi:hypothetical protein